MGGPNKRRALAEKKGTSSSGDSSGRSRDATELSVPKSIPRLDGNRDPATAGFGKAPAVEYSRPQDLKNISEALGYAGWCVARGVSTKAFVACFYARPIRSYCTWCDCKSFKRLAIAAFMPEVAALSPEPQLEHISRPSPSTVLSLAFFKATTCLIHRASTTITSQHIL